jgi:LPXTG-motif cell wall-anchored protein
MPVTGTRLGMLLAIGMLALVVGGFLYLVARRRSGGQPAGGVSR